jgi:hypothetical protein
MQELKMDSATSERRMNELERTYAANNSDPGNLTRLDELRFQISGLIGKNNLNLLREYTDRLIAQYNTDSDWFYQKGVEDARRFSTRDSEKAGRIRFSKG